MAHVSQTRYFNVRATVGLIGQGLMRISLMMYYSRRVMTDLFTKISLVQVEKENV